MKRDKKILFIVNVDWFFISHRIPLAKAAKDQGYSVTVAAEDTGKSDEIIRNDLEFIRIPFSRKGKNIFREFLTLWNLLKIFYKIRPDIVHNVTIKPIIYGSIVSLLFPNIKLVNAVTGRGSLYSPGNHSKFLKRMIETLSTLLYRSRNIHFIFQNEEDKNYYLENKYITNDRSVIIRGSGVNHKIYSPNKSGTEKKAPSILFASRLIKEKGVYEFIQAARTLKNQLPTVRFIVAGMTDEENPNELNEQDLINWQNEGTIEWIGYQHEMIRLIRSVTIVVLPSYYPEGVPKILIEAASIGKPIITTDTPGCRDIVRDGVNGILIEAKNSEQLSNAILKLLSNKNKLKSYGDEGRRIVIENFSEEYVINQTLQLYNLILKK